MRFNSTKPPKKSTGLKALMKEYGYSAFAVYMGLTAIDLPLCYLLVHSMGREEIEHYENEVKQWFGFGVSAEELDKKQQIKRIEEEIETEHEPEVANDSVWGLISQHFSWTEFALAYGIHKSLIFIRVPLCAAITPGIVKLLRRWGFKIGTDKLAKTASIAKDHIKDAANPVAGGVRANKKSKWFSWFI